MVEVRSACAQTGGQAKVAAELAGCGGRGGLAGGRRALVGLLLLSALPLGARGLAACGEDEQADPQVVSPLAITRTERALVLDPRDSPLVASIPKSYEDVVALFPRAVLRSPLHDAVSLDRDLTSSGQAATDEERSFAVRIVAQYQAVARDYPAFDELVVVLDLLDPTGGALVAPPGLRAAELTFQGEASDRFPARVLTQLEQAGRALAEAVPAQTRLSFVIGEGLNVLPDAEEFAAFKGFYAAQLQPALQRIAQDVDREIAVSTALDWEAFLASVPALPSDADADERAAADRRAWNQLLDGLDGKQTPLVLRSHPAAFEAPEDLPADHYQRLRALVGSRSVAFLTLYWPCVSESDTAGARDFLRSFRRLAGGLHLSYVAWPRFFDLGADNCDRFSSQSTGGDRALCYSGLANSRGRLKSLWNEVLDEELPD